MCVQTYVTAEFNIGERSTRVDCLDSIRTPRASDGCGCVYAKNGLRKTEPKYKFSAAVTIHAI